MDVETCNAADGDHVIDIAVVTWRGGEQTGIWSSLLNPGVPVDAHTQLTHGLTDDDLVGEATFADVEPTLSRVLAGLDGELLVLVAHNATFDVSRLRLEYQRIGRPMPDVLVLDTVRFAKHLGLRAAKLSALLSELHLINTKEHSAIGDATATGHAVAALIDRAAAAGAADFDTLLAAVMNGQVRTSSIKPSTQKRHKAAVAAMPAPVELPALHVATHSRLLPAQPSPARLASWQANLTECALLRCPYLTSTIEVAPLGALDILALLERILADRLTRSDGPGAATVLGAISPLLRALPNRAAAIRWHKTWAERLDDASACPPDDRCPACCDEQPCPLDVWRRDLAVAALETLAGTSQRAKSFLHTTGVNTGKGVFTTWHADGHGRLADCAAWEVHEHWRQSNQPGTAAGLAHWAWSAGGRDPRLVAAHARNVATPGTDTHLTKGIEICDEVLPLRGASTDDGWSDLASCRARLAGQLRRRAVKLSDQVEGGTPIPIRRHHPDNPQRSRAPRFFAA